MHFLWYVMRVCGAWGRWGWNVRLERWCGGCNYLLRMPWRNRIVVPAGLLIKAAKMTTLAASHGAHFSHSLPSLSLIFSLQMQGRDLRNGSKEWSRASLFSGPFEKSHYLVVAATRLFLTSERKLERSLMFPWTFTPGYLLSVGSSFINSGSTAP